MGFPEGGVKRQWGGRQHQFFSDVGRYIFGTGRDKDNIIT